MKLNGLLIAAIVLAALTGALYWSNHHSPADITTKASSDLPPKILAIPEADISKIEIKKKGAETVGLSKNDSGKWQIAFPLALGADQDAVSNIVSALSSLSSERLVEDQAGNLSQYGLVQPALEIDITAKEKPHKLLIGDATPAGGAVFAKVEGDPRVFTLANYSKTNVDKGPNDLRDKRLLTADFDTVSQVEVVAKTQDLVFGRNKEEWQIVKPRPLRANNSQVEDFVRKLREAKMELGSNEDEKKAASFFASGTAVATARVTDAAGTQTLQVRKNKEAYYAKSSALDGTFKISADLGKDLGKNVDEFRTKKLFDFGFDALEKIELHDSAKSYFLTKGGADWWSDGKKMDTGGVEELIDKLRQLSASKFVDSGFAAPTLDITVISNSEKRVERVLISKNADHFIAKRENEPALYQLDSAVIAEIQTAAGGLKLAPEPAAPASKKK